MKPNPIVYALIGNFFIWFCLVISIWALFFKHPTPEPSFRYKVEPYHSQTGKHSFSF
jgi:hypothetical protein